MNKPTPFGKQTFAEYEKEVKEYNLSKVKKVNLGIVQDMQKVSDTLNNILKQNDSTLDAAENRLVKLTSILKESKGDLKKYYDVIEKDIVALGKEQDKANKLESEAEKASNDLGIKETELPGYNDMVESASLADDAIGVGDAILNEIDKLLTNL